MRSYYQNMTAEELRKELDLGLVGELLIAGVIAERWSIASALRLAVAIREDSKRTQSEATSLNEG